jgi:hypothetical protein
MLTQKEGVFNAIVELFGFVPAKGVVFDPTKEQRKEIIELVSVEITEGRVDFSAEAKAKYNSFDLVKGYVNGMVSNWLRKDTRLNGGDAYVTKNPGSRAGQGDETLRNLKALKATLTEASHIEAVDEEIAKRTAEIAASKAKTVQVDMSKIPANLLAALGLSNDEET